MAIRECMNIRSYINILCDFGATWISYVTSGEHGYPKLHKYFMAIRGIWISEVK